MFKISLLRFLELDKTKIITTYIVKNEIELFNDCGIKLSENEFKEVLIKGYIDFDNIGFIGSTLNLEEIKRVVDYSNEADNYYVDKCTNYEADNFENDFTNLGV